MIGSPNQSGLAAKFFLQQLNVNFEISLPFYFTTRIIITTKNTKQQGCSSPENLLTPPTPSPTGGVKSSYTYLYSVYIYTSVSYRRLLQKPPPCRNLPLTVIKMVHVTVSPFHINLHANNSYLLDDDPPETDTPPNFKILENTLLNSMQIQI